MMLLHKSTFNLYLECWVAAAQKHTVDVENILEKIFWNHLLLSLGKRWGNNEVHRTMCVKQR